MCLGTYIFPFILLIDIHQKSLIGAGITSGWLFALHIAYSDLIPSVQFDSPEPARDNF